MTEDQDQNDGAAQITQSQAQDNGKDAAAAKAVEEASSNPAASGVAGARPPVLVGFLAISPSAGQRSSDYPARMVSFPILPGFGPGPALRDLEKRLKSEDNNWKGYAVQLGAEGPELVPILVSIAA